MSGTTFSKLPVMIVALVIGLILTFTAVMPLVSDYSDAKTFTNEGLFFVDGLKEDQTVTYSCDSNGAYVDGVAITGKYATGYAGGASIAYTENFIIRWAGTGTFALRGAYWAYDATGPASVTFNGNGTWSLSYTTAGVEATSTGTFTEFYGLVLDKADRVMSGTTNHKYLNSDSLINGTGLTNCTNIGSYIVFNLDGSIDDGISISGYSQTNGSELSLTYSNITINKTEVSGYEDLYDVTSITFDVTDTNDKTDSVTYTVFTVPTEVTADPDNPAAYKNLVSVLPLFALILLVAGAASLVYFKNKD